MIARCVAVTDIPRFVDTNILLYAVGVDPAESAKQVIASEILRSRTVVLSVQVLQEFFWQATRRSRRDRLPDEDAAAFVESWKRFPIQPQTMDVLERAIAICRRTQLSYWDGAIVAAAAFADCRILLSEDMQHGQIIDGVRIVNPFL